jgi:Leucine-rich repeat (LRR) protein
MTTLNISRSGITSLKDFFEKNRYYYNVAYLVCSYNKLTTLAGCPTSVIVLYCNNNLLNTIADCPNSVTDLYCSNNLLTTLSGCPDSVNYLDCSDNLLTTLSGCPDSVNYLDCDNNLLAKYPKTLLEFKKYNKKINLKLVTRRFKIIFRECITLL